MLKTSEKIFNPQTYLAMKDNREYRLVCFDKAIRVAYIFTLCLGPLIGFYAGLRNIAKSMNEQRKDEIISQDKYYLPTQNTNKYIKLKK